MKKVKIYNIGKNTTFDLSQLNNDLEPGNYIVKTQAVSILGHVSKESNGISYTINPDIPVEPRDIWIKFKFLNTNYNPQVNNLAVGTKESNGKERNFKADWQLVNEAENIWMWGVTEGTNLDSAFRYGDGEQSFPLLIAEDYLTGISDEMWQLEGYSSKQGIINDTKSWWTDEVEAGNVKYTGNVEVIDWDLMNATSLDFLFGGNPYWRTAIVGTLPELTSNSNHAVYMFGRLYDVTSVGKITLPSITGDIQKLLFAMTSLQELPELDIVGNPQTLDMLFWQSCNASKTSIENAYGYLSTNFSQLGHRNTFKQCGTYKDSSALDNIPASWGGNL